MKRIAMKPEMSRATREGRKLETRRLMNPQPNLFSDCQFSGFGACGNALFQGTREPGEPHVIGPIPPYFTGDVIGVAEAWRVSSMYDALSGRELVERGVPLSAVHFEADHEAKNLSGRYRQARFLPDAFVRTKLKIVEVRAERLNEITEEGAKAEGAEGEPCYPVGSVPGDGRTGWTLYLPAFQKLWDSIHGKDAPWASNPWVFVYRFEVLP